MNWDMIAGNWMQFKGRVKERWGNLTEDTLTTIGGRREQLLGKIQEAYGVTVEEAESQLKAFEKEHKNFQPKGKH